MNKCRIYGTNYKEDAFMAINFVDGKYVDEKGITKLLELNVSELEKKLLLETDGK